MYLECSLRFSTFTWIFCIGLVNCLDKRQRTAFMREKTPRKRHKSIPFKQMTKSKEYTFITVVVTDISQLTNCSVGRVAQPVYRLTTGWTVRGSNSDWSEIFHACPDRPSCPPSLLYNGYRVFPGVKVRPGRAADQSTHSSVEVMEK
jgi:hypothetical protein